MRWFFIALLALAIMWAIPAMAMMDDTGPPGQVILASDMQELEISKLCPCTYPVPSTAAIFAPDAGELLVRSTDVIVNGNSVGPPAYDGLSFPAAQHESLLQLLTSQEHVHVLTCGHRLKAARIQGGAGLLTLYIRPVLHPLLS